MIRQWSTRIDLELIKMRHATVDVKDKKTKLQMKEEIEAFIAKAY